MLLLLFNLEPCASRCMMSLLCVSELRWCELGEVWLCACAECSDVSDSIDSPSDRRPLAEYVLLKGEQ